MGEKTRITGVVFTSMAEEIPGSIRIRTGDGNEYRYHAVEEASEFYECNRSDAVAYACDNVPALVEAVGDVLARGDLTTAQKRDIAEHDRDPGQHHKESNAPEGPLDRNESLLGIQECSAPDDCGPKQKHPPKRIQRNVQGPKPGVQG